jgi:hypothetical protein
VKGVALKLPAVAPAATALEVARVKSQLQRHRYGRSDQAAVHVQSSSRLLLVPSVKQHRYGRSDRAAVHVQSSSRLLLVPSVKQQAGRVVRASSRTCLLWYSRVVAGRAALWLP